jgi:NTP pyrophosphatase (non-canonical NTP hydrolase)
MNNMNELIEKVRQWGVEKNIIGINGEGTRYKQSDKMIEEAAETHHAVTTENLAEVKDGIGDVVVTLILLADMYDLTLEECLQEAYNVISKRTGKVINGTFVKSSDL